MYPRGLRWLASLGLPALALLGATTLGPGDASAAEPTNAGKRFRFHGELDVLSFSHWNPDGDGDNDNTIGFGFGRVTGVDRQLALPSWSLGFGYVFLDGNAIVGGRFAFNLESSGDDDDAATGDPDDEHQPTVSGQLVPYFRYLFLPGRRVRPFLEARFGFGGSTDRYDTGSDSTIYPTVGFGGGAHIFIVDAFSVDLGLLFDYAAPHSRSTSEVGDTRTEEDYDKNGDYINLAAQAGFSAWF